MSGQDWDSVARRIDAVRKRQVISDYVQGALIGVLLSIVWFGIAWLLSACATVEQPKIVARIPPPEILKVAVPVRCVKSKPEVPKTVITAPIMAGAEAAVAALASPPPEITKEQLSEWIGAIDKLVASLLVDLYKLKSYAADADPKLTECMIDPEVSP